MAHRDMIVIGGGPAGAATAIRAAQHGINVTVFEKVAMVGTRCAAMASLRGLSGH